MSPRVSILLIDSFLGIYYICEMVVDIANPNPKSKAISTIILVIQKEVIPCI